MNKVEMADRLAARTGLSKAAAREAVDSVFAAIGDALANGEEVRIAGFGIFGTRSRPARTGRNPRNGEAVSLPASDVADIPGREDAEGCRQCRSRVMTRHLQPTRPGSDLHRLHVEFSRLLCDDGHSASCLDGTGKSQDSVGLTTGLLPVWVRHRI